MFSVLCLVCRVVSGGSVCVLVFRDLVLCVLSGGSVVC